MFEATKWKFDFSLKSSLQKGSQMIVFPPSQSRCSPVKIFRRFDFSSELQRMCVITRAQNEKIFRLHVKGSPEKILELCKISTIPENYLSVMDFYTKVKILHKFIQKRPL